MRDQRGILNNSYKHGLCKHPLYSVWRSLRERCNNPKAPKYYLYGGRGIKVSKEWDSFLVFLNDMGNKPSKEHSIDRIDTNGNYCKENCRWATKSQQCLNRRVYRHKNTKGIIKKKTGYVIKIQGIHVGYYKEEEIARKVYEETVKEWYGK